MSTLQSCAAVDSNIYRITSYINNLHPRGNEPLYEAVEKIIAKAIPLWNRTLGPLSDDPGSPVVRIPFEGPVYNPDPNNVPDDEKPQQRDDEDEDDYWERLVSEWRPTLLVYPEPRKFVKPKESAFDLREKFAEKGLQVIVKLANIHLTPEKPEYAGGTWHVEGQLVSSMFRLVFCAVAKCLFCSNRTNTFARPRFTTMTVPTLPKAGSHSANSQRASLLR